jgi:hypothetical protein
VLAADSAVELGLIPENEKNTKIVVIVSHDCDLAFEDFETEPFAEILIGNPIPICDVNMVYAKNPRILHLEFDSGDKRMALEFTASEKKRVDRRLLLDHLPSVAYSLDAVGLETLQSWLAARYKRAAIPDELQKLTKDIFQDVGKKNPHAIHGIWLAYEPDSEILPEGERYEIYVVIVYATTVSDSKVIGEHAANQVREKFERKFAKMGALARVELRQCVVRADTEFTYHDLLHMKRFRLEYLSLKANPPAETEEY